MDSISHLIHREWEIQEYTSKQSYKDSLQVIMHLLIILVLCVERVSNKIQLTLYNYILTSCYLRSSKGKYLNLQVQI